ncbi:hypothetical protein N7468_005012 [Penicillium chermesinum]|uniref:Uncharacterized protein n=1 Tax=Penicillium chermesinum TaxID=63820 RepID=A0A9W9TMK4_9EURO|nr:uncharacterized protein N7468_005012 [Penicillium chermesinum]KAJ5232056.1 hypothetical protein N7468_005012 [Penicillium chermesinum]
MPLTKLWFPADRRRIPQASGDSAPRIARRDSDLRFSMASSSLANLHINRVLVILATSIINHWIARAAAPGSDHGAYPVSQVLYRAQAYNTGSTWQSLILWPE